MEERNLVISYDQHKCRIDGQKGVIKSVKIVENMPNGVNKTVHSEIRVEMADANPGYKSLLKFLKLPSKNNNLRRAA